MNQKVKKNSAQAVKTKKAVKSRQTPRTKAKTKAKAKTKKVKLSEEALATQRIDALILDHRENGRKLGRSILRKWRVRMPADEIDSVVDLALCEAAKRFNEKFGASFMTFFFYHLRGHLVRAVARAANSNNIFMAFAQNMGMEADDWPHVSNEVIWAYAPDTRVFGQQEIETPEKNIIRQEREEQCRDAIGKLDPLEQEVISRSFHGEQPLVNIARNLGYSRCHVSRVKKAALERLKVILDEGSDSSLGSTLREKRVLQSINGSSAGTRPRRRARRRVSAKLEQIKQNEIKAA